MIGAGVHQPLILPRHHLRPALEQELAAIDEHGARVHSCTIVCAAWLTNRMVPPSLLDLLDAREALALERLVADRQRLVDHQDVGVDVDGGGEGEPHVHAARVGLDRLVDEVADVGEAGDGVEALVDLGPGRGRGWRALR